jgi:hypothetical protein
VGVGAEEWARWPSRGPDHDRQPIQHREYITDRPARGRGHQIRIEFVTDNGGGGQHGPLDVVETKQFPIEDIRADAARLRSRARLAARRSPGQVQFAANRPTSRIRFAAGGCRPGSIGSAIGDRSRGSIGLVAAD